MLCDVDHESVVIILSTNAASPDDQSLARLAGVRVQWQRIDYEGRLMCVAARLRHVDPPDRFGARVREWARARGWAVTVASCGTRG
jgi:hypothetical protein